MEKIKNKKILNDKHEESKELDKIHNIIGALNMRIHFAKEDITFFKSAITLQNKLLKKLGKSK